MAEAPIAAIGLHHIALPTRREHKWTGLTEPIGGYVLVKMTDEAGLAGWGEAPALKDWGGDFGRYFGETFATTIEVITRHLAPAVKGALPGEIAELHARMDHAIKGYPYAKAAVEFARQGGARIVEGYPVEPNQEQADAFVYTGLASAFRKAGFKEVLRRSPTRPMMRRILKRGSL